jgi:2-polyprenyl-3-methyl-5-hydroxy-6-metoxy-1,4-benzoquinol methylase
MSAPDDYRAKYNPELLKLIPPDAKAVLEVGCGDGILAAMYRMRNPEVEWYGFDVNREAIVEAAKPGRCTFARECDAEREDVYRFNVYEGCNLYRGNPDVLIFGDVLEHMLDPWTALNRIVKDAKPGSLVLASIPNIGHWTVIRGLMKGEFDYADDGLLDRTHLRFFTLKSIKSMFADAGLQVFELRGRRLMNERMDEWARSAGISLTPEMSAFQYVVRAIKRNPTVTEVTRNGDDAAIAETQPPISRLHIHAVVHRCTENGTCCERSRIDEPLAAMATIPGVAAMKTDTPIGIGDDLPDVLIQQRHHVLNIHQQQYVERSSTPSRSAPKPSPTWSANTTRTSPCSRINWRRCRRGRTRSTAEKSTSSSVPRTGGRIGGRSCRRSIGSSASIDPTT